MSLNFQPVIDNMPWILAALGLLLWGLARMIEAYARRDPAINEWDKRAETLHKVSQQYAQAIDWLVQVGAAKWSGAQKLDELSKRVKEFEADWGAGRYIEALSKLSGFYQSAMSKLEKAQAVALPFAIRPSLAGNQPESQETAAIGPDSPAVEENTDGK
jgi:DNA repair ATPase RecN